MSKRANLTSSETGTLDLEQNQSCGSLEREIFVGKGIPHLARNQREVWNDTFLLGTVCGYAFSGTGHGCTFQMSAAYSAMVRSLENLPEPATFKMALRAHS